ncbi:MAG: glycosyltransferase [Bacteroidota bacterium]
MNVDYDIIMLALPRWDGQYSSTSFSLAKALSRHTRVFYVDNPFTVKDYISNRNTQQIKRRKKALMGGKDIFTQIDANYPNLTGVTPAMTLPINWIPSGFVYNVFSRLNNAIVHRALKQTVKTYGIKKFIFINSFNPLFGRYGIRSLKPFLNIYQSVDDISQAPYMQKHGTTLEEKAIRDADFTIVTSSELKRLKSAFSPQVYLLPNAAHVALFQQAVKEVLTKPAELQSIAAGTKIICYTGNICHRLDYDLLIKISLKHSDKILLMIGPFANNNYKIAGLDKMPNVIFTGRKDISELPAYLKYSDCCIIPFLCNQLTRSIYPLKINEYLSAGKPVVTTNFSEDIFNFKGIAFVANNREEFLTQIDIAVESDTPEKQKERINFSASNNWDARAEQFIEMVNSFQKSK